LRLALRKKISSSQSNRATQHTKDLVNSKNGVNSADLNLIQSGLGKANGGVYSVKTRAEKKRLRQQQVQAQASLEKLESLGLDAKELMASMSDKDKEFYVNQFVKSNGSIDSALQSLDQTVSSSSSSSSLTNSSSATTMDSETIKAANADKSTLEKILFETVVHDQISNPSAEELDKATKEGLPIMERTELL
jgi:hypothetical protein